jgi:hypothetical protein
MAETKFVIDAIDNLWRVARMVYLHPDEQVLLEVKVLSGEEIQRTRTIRESEADVTDWSKESLWRSETLAYVAGS